MLLSIDPSNTGKLRFQHNGARTPEAIIRYHILRLLDSGGWWTVERIVKEIDKLISFAAGDIRRSDERPNEAVWHQKVRNALAPSRTNSLTSQGYVKSPARDMYQITAAGREHLETMIAFEAYALRHLNLKE